MSVVTTHTKHPAHTHTHTHILRKSSTSGEIGDAPEKRHRTRPPNTIFTLLKTNRSQMGDGVFPEKKNHPWNDLSGFMDNNGACAWMQKTMQTRLTKKKEDPENRSMNFKGTVRKASIFLDLSQVHPFSHYMQHWKAFHEARLMPSLLKWFYHDIPKNNKPTVRWKPAGTFAFFLPKETKWVLHSLT